MHADQNKYFFFKFPFIFKDRQSYRDTFVISSDLCQISPITRQNGL